MIEGHHRASIAICAPTSRAHAGRWSPLLPIKGIMRPNPVRRLGLSAAELSMWPTSRLSPRGIHGMSNRPRGVLHCAIDFQCHPGMPSGEPSGSGVSSIDANRFCFFGHPEQPAVVGSFQPSEPMRRPDASAVSCSAVRANRYGQCAPAAAVAEPTEAAPACD